MFECFFSALLVDLNGFWGFFFFGGGGVFLGDLCVFLGCVLGLLELGFGCDV